jgi:tyrosine-protein kinase Etk/Wzc
MSIPAHTNGGPYPTHGSRPLPEPVLSAWGGVVRRRWGWGVATFALVMGAVVAMVFLQVPIYRADARIRLADPPPMSGVNPSAGMLGLFGLGGNAFANDFQVLRSRTLREAVVAERALNVQLEAPVGWHRDSLFTALSADRETQKATFEVTWTASGDVEVRSAANDSLVGTFAPSTPASFGGVTAVFRPRQAHTPERFALVTAPFGEAVRGLEGRLETQRAARDANVLDVRFDDRDPKLAEGVVASAVAHFIALRSELYRRESGQAVDSLRTVSAQTLQELESAEDRLEDLQRESGLVAVDAQSEAMVERYSAALLAAETFRAELDLVEDALARVDTSTNPGEAWISLVAHPQFLENPTVGEMLVQMTALEQQRILLAATRSPENLEYATVLEQIASLDQSLRALARSYRTGTEQRARVAEAKVAELEGMIAAAPAKLRDLLDRQREMRVLTEVVVLTEQRLRQEELRQALTLSNAQVIDPAALRFKPVWPRKKLMLAGGLLIALGFAVLGMVVVERADGGVRSARQLAPYMASPLLAAVPAGRRNGKPAVVQLSSAEVDVLLRRGRVDDAHRSHLVLVSAGALADAESVARALEGAVSGAAHGAPHPNGGNVNGAAIASPNGGSAANGGAPLVPTVTVLPPVTSPAAAEAVARQGAPVLVVLRAGETDGRAVAAMVELLTRAGAPVAGGVLLCRSTREADIAWT